ncbi:YidC/Oxa1 family membrane protein insertase [Papillibacter cinnamivorans]|uniref:YidC/Oxa1 family membrane protein insertase n=1 Tax=Papillibacter cinnamivorans DSM 12816 TaxID=1122930 RepID=A0A1W2A9H2_9FIRM|nr:YidC/Oxa1 family membrane protein insertase [Papillibacter cinnamivorans]SMC57290.1 YidC/Oxa1 family membrane protein insertase [Papillibacter cinnamivorans DSM 12816]
MDFFGAISGAIIAPFSLLLRGLYSISMSYGLSIILFSLVVKLILLPTSVKMKRSTMGSSRLAPRIKELEKKYKNDQQRYAEEVQKLYKEENVHPFGGCLWGLLPLPIMLALYTVIRMPLSNFMNLTQDQITTITNTLTNLGVDLTSVTGSYKEILLAQKMFEHYDAVKAVVPQIFKLDFSFLGLNLAQVPNWNLVLSGNLTWNSIGLFLIPIVSGLLAFVSTKLSMAASSTNTEMNSTSKSMMYTMPLVSVWIGFVLPASLGIYWISNSIFTIIQEYFLNKHFKKKFEEADAVRRAEEERVKALEAQRQALLGAQRKTENKGGPSPSKGKKKQGKLPARSDDAESGKVDDRPFARGRAYRSERYEGQIPEPEEQALTVRPEEVPEEEDTEPEELESGADTAENDSASEDEKE